MQRVIASIFPLRTTGLELSQPHLPLRQRLLLDSEHGRIVGAVVPNQVRAMEAVALRDGLFRGAQARVEVGGDSRVAPGVTCEGCSDQ